MACGSFLLSNVHNEPLINLCHVTDRNENEIGIQERGDLLICGFWDKTKDCIIDAHIYDVNQLSYLSRKPTTILK